MNYYNNHSKEFIEDTFNCDMKRLYDFFESYLMDNFKILDIGFGSSRDMLYFKNKGYEVYGIDSSIEMYNNAKKLGLNNIYNIDILDMNFDEDFDAIWACASLLHIKSSNLNEAFKKCSKALKNKGVMYCSFKYGEFEGIRNGRFYIDMTEDNFINYLKSTNLNIIKTMITEDVRNDKTTKWLNVILEKM